MLHKRRQFILGSGAVIIGSASTLFSGCKARDDLTPDAKTLISIIDTIIPQDEFAGAIDIGLDIKLQQQTEQRPKIKELLSRIVNSVTSLSSQQYQTPFFELNIDQREGLLNSIIKDYTKPLVRRDLVLLRNTLFTSYYQSEVGTASIGYVLPTNYPAYDANVNESGR